MPITQVTTVDRSEHAIAFPRAHAIGQNETEIKRMIKFVAAARMGAKDVHAIIIGRNINMHCSTRLRTSIPSSIANMLKISIIVGIESVATSSVLFTTVRKADVILARALVIVDQAIFIHDHANFVKDALSFATWD